MLICFCFDGRVGVIPGLGSVRVTQGGAYPVRAGGGVGVDSARTGEDACMGVGAGEVVSFRTEEMGLNTLSEGEAGPFVVRGGISAYGLGGVAAIDA